LLKAKEAFVVHFRSCLGTESLDCHWRNARTTIQRKGDMHEILLLRIRVCYLAVILPRKSLVVSSCTMNSNAPSPLPSLKTSSRKDKSFVKQPLHRCKRIQFVAQPAQVEYDSFGLRCVTSTRFKNASQVLISKDWP